MSGAVTATVAVVSIAIAASEVAAVGLTIGSALLVTAAVGATVSAVGAFTGDKTLQTVGMIIGAVGAVGSLANSAGLLGELGAMPIFGAGNSAADAGIAGSAQAAATAASNAGPVTIAEGASPFLEGAAAVSGSQPATIEAVARAVDPTVTGLASPEQAASLVPSAAGQGDAAVASTVAQASTAAPAEPPLVSQPTAPEPPPATTPASTATTTQPGAAPQAPQAPQAATPPAPAPPSTSLTSPASMMAPAGARSVGLLAGVEGPATSTFGGFLDFMNKNPMLAYGAIQAGSSFFAGVFGAGEREPSQQQLAAWQAQANANNAAANYQNQITSNIQSGMPVSNKPPPTGNTTPLMSRPAVTGTV